MAVKPPRGVLLSKAEADRLAKLYMKAELEIVKAINQALERRNDTRYLRAMLENVKKIQADLLKGTRAWSEQAVPRLYREGMKEAESQLQRAGLSVKFGFGAVHQQAVQVLAENSYRRLADVVQVIGRRVEDLYRETALEATRQSIVGYKSWGEVARDIRKRLEERGITAFKDARNRTWDLSTYSEMVARTTTAEAHLAGTGNRILESGHDLVVISSHNSPCEKCARWEGKVVSLTGKTPGHPTLEQAKDEGLFHPNCFPAGVLVSGPAPLASMTRWYEGQLVVIQTASGIELPVTPNHPILTTKGWVAAGLLVEGDEVIRYVGQERMVRGSDPHYQQVPTRIEDVAGAFGESCGMSAFRVPVAPEDFHGDGIGSEICIVRTDSLLRDDVDTARFEPCGKQRFSLALVDCLCLLGKGAFDQFIGRTLCAPYGGVGRCHESGPILGSHSCQPGFHGFASAGGRHDTGLAEAFVHGHFSDAEGPGNVALGLPVQIPLDDFFCGNRESTGSSEIAWRTDPDTAFAKNRRNEIGADTERTRELVARLAQDIAVDKVVGVDSRTFVGHVYNLQTRDGWYAANTIVAHNCRHTYYWQLELEEAERQDRRRTDGERSRPVVENYDGDFITAPDGVRIYLEDVPARQRKPESLVEEALRRAEKHADFRGVRILNIPRIVAGEPGANAFMFADEADDVIYLLASDVGSFASRAASELEGLYRYAGLYDLAAKARTLAADKAEYVKKTLLHELGHIEHKRKAGNFRERSAWQSLTKYIDEVFQANLAMGGGANSLDIEELAEWVAEDYRLLKDPGSIYPHAYAARNDLFSPESGAKRRRVLREALGW